jgi:predicted Zn-dependent peptidase
MADGFDPNLFYVYAVAADGVSAEQLETSVLAQIDRLIKEGVSEEELQKVKNQKLMEFYRGIQTINGKANNIGTYEMFFGDYRKLYEAPRLFEQVTPADIQRVAATYFTKRNRTVGYLLPETGE